MKAINPVILGVDPGSRILGYGLIQKRGHQLVPIENGFVALKNTMALGEKLELIYSQLAQIIKKYKPTELVIERVFFHKNVLTVQRLGEVRGICLLLAQMAKMAQHEYTARQAKQAITGYGNASKEQMQQMVRVLLNLRDLAEENASDALALAICHANNQSKFLLPHPQKPNSSVKDLLAKASFYR